MPPDAPGLDNALAELVAAARGLALNPPVKREGDGWYACASCDRSQIAPHAHDCEWHRLARAVEALDEARRNQ